MGLGGIGIWQLVIILVIIVMLFGTKKLRNVGTDLGGALKGFKKAMKDDDTPEDEETRLLNERADAKTTTDPVAAKKSSEEV